MDEEEIDPVELLKKYSVPIVILCVIILAFYSGQMYGYRQGYSYVKEYHENYIDGCVCINRSTELYIDQAAYSEIIKK